MNINASDDEYRFSMFSETLDFINEHNSKKTQLTLGLNQFSAFSNAEFQERTLT